MHEFYPSSIATMVKQMHLTERASRRPKLTDKNFESNQTSTKHSQIWVKQKSPFYTIKMFWVNQFYQKFDRIGAALQP